MASLASRFAGGWFRPAVAWIAGLAACAGAPPDPAPATVVTIPTSVDDCGLAFTPDEASVFACGVDYREDGFGFVVDVASGGIVATPPTYCHEWQPDPKGTAFQVDGGVIDLERRPDRPAPEPFPLEVPPQDTAVTHRDATTLPEGTPGLVCRFGELVAPFAVCPDTAPRASAAR